MCCGIVGFGYVTCIGSRRLVFVIRGLGGVIGFFIGILVWGCALIAAILVMRGRIVAIGYLNYITFYILII